MVFDVRRSSDVDFLQPLRGRSSNVVDHSAESGGFSCEKKTTIKSRSVDLRHILGVTKLVLATTPCRHGVVLQRSTIVSVSARLWIITADYIIMK